MQKTITKNYSKTLLSITGYFMVISLSFSSVATISASAQQMAKYPNVQLSSPDQVLKDGGQIDNSIGSNNGLDINGSTCTNEYKRFDDPGYNVKYDPKNPDAFLRATASPFYKCVTTNGNLLSTITGYDTQLPREQALARYQKERSLCGAYANGQPATEGDKKRCLTLALNRFAESTSVAFQNNLAPQTTPQPTLPKLQTPTLQPLPPQPVQKATQPAQPAANQGGGGFNLGNIGGIFEQFKGLIPGMKGMFGGLGGGSTPAPETQSNIGTQRQQNSGFAPNTNQTVNSGSPTRSINPRTTRSINGQQSNQQNGVMALVPNDGSAGQSYYSDSEPNQGRTLQTNKIASNKNSKDSDSTYEYMDEKGRNLRCTTEECTIIDGKVASNTSDEYSQKDEISSFLVGEEAENYFDNLDNKSNNKNKKQPTRVAGISADYNYDGTEPTEVKMGGYTDKDGNFQPTLTAGISADYEGEDPNDSSQPTEVASSDFGGYDASSNSGNDYSSQPTEVASSDFGGYEDYSYFGGYDE